MSQIKWTNAGGGDFGTGANWMGGMVPGMGDDAILPGLGSPYTVTSGGSPTVNSIQVAQANTLEITGGTFYAINGSGSGSDNGVIKVDNTASFEAGGTIAGSGAIDLNSGGNGTEFILATGSVTLSGGGSVVLSDSSTNTITSSSGSDTLVNAGDTISGAGQLGGGSMKLANGAAGVIDATGLNNVLVVSLSAGTNTNAGLIEATAVGGLRISGSTITQSGTGTIKAAGAGVAVSLDGGVIISGGTLATSAGGVIQTVSTGELSGVAITAGSTVSANNNTSLLLDGTITNAGTIGVDSVGNGTSLIVNSATVTLTGGGKLVLTDNGNNQVYGAAAADRLVNTNNIISGSGNIGAGTLSLVNAIGGVIDATGTAAGLTIQTTSFSNAGLLEDTASAGLGIDGSVIVNTGTIAAFGAGTSVNLYGGASEQGGTLATSGGGVIETTNGGTLDGSGSHPVTITRNSQVAVQNNSSMYVLGSIVNSGTIGLDSVANGTNLIIDSASVTLSGGGAVLLTDNGNNAITGAATGDALINTNNVISGSGNIGAGIIALTNAAGGVIDATGTAAGLTIQTTSFSNAGLLEDTNTGGLGLDDISVTNTGTIGSYGTGSTVNIYGGSTVVGGTLDANHGGIIETTNGFLDGSGKHAVTLTAGSQLDVLNNTSLYVLGSLVNHGTILIDSAGNGTNLIVGSPTLTLSGGGAVTLTDSNNEIFGAAGSAPFDTLVNVDNFISGSGNIGAGQLNLVNQASGVIDATGTGTGLTIQTNAFTNAGLVEDTGPAGVGVNASTIVNSGTLAAFGAGTSFNIYSGAAIEGGVIATSGGGVFETTSSGTLDGATNGALTISTGSRFNVTNNAALYLAGSIVNHGTINLQSAGNGTPLIVNTPTVTLSGGGAILLSDSSQNEIYGAAATDTLVNVDNAISGAGNIGEGALTLVNQAAGIINATGTGGLTIQTSAFTNNGLLEATGIGGLGVEGSTIVNDSTILASGTGTTINLYNSASIEGGVLAAKNGAVFESTNSGTLDGLSNGALTLATGTTFNVGNNIALYIDGSIVNHGTIALLGAGNGTPLIANSATVTLSGGGTIAMSDNGANEISGAATLVNVDNLITGSGNIGNASQLILVNDAGGTIDATGTAGITFQTASFNNAGLVEDTGSGGIGIDGVTIVNTGTIEAVGAGTSLDLYNSAAIAGGTVAATGGGVIETVNAGTLDGATHGALTLTARTQVVIANSLAFYLDGAIVNQGTFQLQSAGNGTSLVVNSPTVTLSGGGAVVLSDNSQNYIDGFTSTDRLVNVNNVISGAGNLGNDSLVLDNQAAGTIDATGTNALVVSLNSQAFTNEGLAEAAGSGGLLIQNSVLTNSGTLAALSDSTATIASTTTLTNYTAGTLTGGTYEAISAGGTHTATLALNDIGTIGIDAATLVLSGAGSSIIAGGTAVETTISTITSKGALELLNNRTVTRTTSLSNAGLILLGGGKLAVTNGKFTNNGTVQAQSGGTLTVGKSVTLSNLAGGTLTGGTWIASGSGSTIALAPGTVTVDAAVITLSGAGSVFNSGTAAATLESTLTTVAGAGVLNVLGGRNFASTAGSFTDSGVVTLGGGTLSAAGLTITSSGSLSGVGTIASAVTDNGALVGSGSGVLTLSAAVSGSGVLGSTAGAQVNATGGYSVGTLTVDTGSVLNGAGSVTGAATVNGTLGIGGGTLTAAGVSVGTAGVITGGSISASGSIADSGVISLSTGGTVGAASLSVATGASLTGAAASITGAVTDSGLISLTGTLGAGSITVGGQLAAGTITASGTIADSGLVSLSGGTLSASSLTVGAGGTLGGFGTVMPAVGNSGTIDAKGGTLTLAAGESGGALAVEASAGLVSTTAVAATSLTIAAGGGFTGFGSIGGLTSDAGHLTATGGTLSLAGDSGPGNATISTKSTLSVGSALVLGGGVSFTTGGFTEVLALGTAMGNTTVISNFGTGTVIDLKGAVANTVSFSKGVLTLKEGTTLVAQLNLAGSYTKKNFKLKSDGNGGTNVTFAATKMVPADPMADLKAAAGVAAAALAAPAQRPAPAPAGAGTLQAVAGWSGLDLHAATHAPGLMLIHQS